MINFFIGFLVALLACAISGIILTDYSYSKGFTQGYITAKQLKDLADPDARYINATELIKRLQQAGLDDAVSIAVKMAGHERLKRVPAAQPKIIYCGECKYKDDGIDECGVPFLKCLNGRSYGGTRINDYCSWAERRGEQE